MIEPTKLSLESIPEASAILNENREFLEVNNAFCILFGYSKKDLLSNKISVEKLFSRESNENLLKNQNIDHVGFDMITKNRVTFSAIITYNKIENSENRILMIQERSVLEISNLKKYREFINSAKKNFAMVYYRFEGVGPSPIAQLNLAEVKLDETIIRMIGIYYMSAIQFEKGLYGPLPIKDKPDYSALIYSFQVKDELKGTAKADHRFKGFIPAMIAIIFHKDYSSLFSNRAVIRKVFQKVINDKKSQNQDSEMVYQILIESSNQFFDYFKDTKTLTSDDSLLELNLFLSQRDTIKTFDKDTEILSEHLRKVIDFKECIIWQLDRTLQGFRKIIRSEQKSSEGEKVIGINENKNIVKMMESKQSVVSNTSFSEGKSQATNTGSTAFIPVISPFDFKIVGLLIFNSELEEAFKQEQILILESVGSKIAPFFSRNEIESRYSSMFNLLESMITCKECNPKSMFEVIGDFVRLTFNYDKFAGFLLNKEKQEFELLEYRGYDKEAVKGLTIPLNEKNSIVARCAREKKIINIKNVKVVDFYYQVDEKTHSELAVPILIDNEVIGVLDIESNLKNAFDTTDERIMLLISDMTNLIITFRNAKDDFLNFFKT